MKTPAPFGLLLFVVLLVSPLFGGRAFGAEVTIGGFGFEPKNIEISAGETVKWTNKATLAHTVTSGDNCQKDGQFDSPFLFPEKTKPEKSVFERTFDTPGVYKYYCKTHCQGEKMTGTVTVK
ncbi:MAG: cupredoxin domain-containing protein [Nitrospinae bacterium]|nr:cupredoxin domain-containing protein [Nitrospinota bacterium]